MPVTKSGPDYCPGCGRVMAAPYCPGCGLPNLRSLNAALGGEDTGGQIAPGAAQQQASGPGLEDMQTRPRTTSDP